MNDFGGFFVFESQTYNCMCGINLGFEFMWSSMSKQTFTLFYFSRKFFFIGRNRAKSRVKHKITSKNKQIGLLTFKHHVLRFFNVLVGARHRWSYKFDWKDKLNSNNMFSFQSFLYQYIITMFINVQIDENKQSIVILYCCKIWVQNWYYLEFV